MPSTLTSPQGVTITLDAEERNELLTFLEQELKETKIEAHRTDAIEYREYVERKQSIIQRLVDRLKGK